MNIFSDKLISYYYIVTCITAKLLVASGFPIPTGENIEILDLIDPNFIYIFKDERAKRGGEAIGGMLKNQALIVGGSVLAPKGPYKNYIILGNNHWIIIHKKVK